MTERNDRERRSTEEEDAQPLHRLEPEDEVLLRWLIGYVGASLLLDGFSPSEARAIVRDALNEYVAFRKHVPDAREFLVKRALLKAGEYMRLRDIRPVSGPQDPGPHVLDLIRTRETLAAMPEKIRTALFIICYEHGSYEDVARELGVTVACAQRLVRKAVLELEKPRAQQKPRE